MLRQLHYQLSQHRYQLFQYLRIDLNGEVMVSLLLRRQLLHLWQDPDRHRESIELYLEPLGLRYR